MKYITKEPSEIMKVALVTMLFSTCGEDEDVLRNSYIETIGPDIFHITYKPDNQFEGMDFCVAVDAVRDTFEALAGFHYHIFRSKFADDGKFSIHID